MTAPKGILHPVAELEVQRSSGEHGEKTEIARFRCAGDINDRPAYRRIDHHGVEERLFWMESQRGAALPKMGRWMLVMRGVFVMPSRSTVGDCRLVNAMQF